jgi:hypothetical protein
MMNTGANPFEGIVGAPSQWLAKIPSVLAPCVLPIARTPVEQVRKGHGFTRTNVSDVNLRLRSENTQLLGEVTALKKALFQAKRFAPPLIQAGFEGLVQRVGAPTKSEPKKRLLRVEAAGCMMELSKMLQGPSLCNNAVEMVQAATLLDPQVPSSLIAAGSFPSELELVPDKRFKSGIKLKEKKIMHKKAAFLWQATNFVSNKAVKGIRQYGGKRLMDTPNALQEWAASQPELPEFEFVMPGSSAVWTPPSMLLQKLLENDTFVLRYEAPFEKMKAEQKIFAFLLVTRLCSSVIIQFILDVLSSTALCLNLCVVI